MRKPRPQPTGKLTKSTKSWPAPEPGWEMFTQRLSAGLAELSFTYFAPTDPDAAAALTSEAEQDSAYRFMWQFMTEPEFDYGFSTTYGVLFDRTLGAVGRRSPESLEADLAQHLGRAEWAELKARAMRTSEMTNGDDNWRVLITALWAEHLAEPLSVVWLAAMAQHAYYIANEDFAFGYLTALLDQRLKNEGHFERGAKAVESATQGGLSRAAEHRRRRAQILPEMARLVSRGHSVSRAAELAFGAGHGTSPEANRRLWARHARSA